VLPDPPKHSRGPTYGKAERSVPAQWAHSPGTQRFLMAVECLSKPAILAATEELVRVTVITWVQIFPDCDDWESNSAEGGFIV